MPADGAFSLFSGLFRVSETADPTDSTPEAAEKHAAVGSNLW
jgi:hypothetical protein